MHAAVPPWYKRPVFFLPLVVIAAFAGGFLLRGSGSSSPRPLSHMPVPRPEERLAVPDLENIGRYLGVVADVRSDSVVVLAPDRPGQDAKQHPVTLKVTARTRFNSVLEKAPQQGQRPEDGGVPATLQQIMKNDVVGFTGGSPYTASEFEASTITIIARLPAR